MLEAVKVTVYVPDELYLCEGFCSVEFAVLSPKFHCHAVGEFVLASVNCTFSGDTPIVGVPVKSTTGGNAIVT